jgi:hypothetical protein
MVDPTLVSGSRLGIDTTAGFVRWWRRSRGEKRALVAEMKDNHTYLEMVINDGVPLFSIIDDLSIDCFVGLRNSGFNFNSLKSERIGSYRVLTS